MSTIKETGAVSGIRLALINGSYQSVANLYYLVVRSVYIILFARLLGVELYGYYVYSQSWYVLALAIAAWGMNELVIADYARLKPGSRVSLVASGFSLRLILTTVAALLLIATALLFEPDGNLRLLIIIYAQGVVVRGMTSWFSALFVARQSSQYWLYLTVPFLTLEVLVAVILAASGAGLVAIAMAQCVIWWLQLFVTWFLYWQKFEPIRPGLDWRHIRFFLSNGPSLALAAFILTFMGPGLLIIYRYFADTGYQLGEAAFVIQVLVVIGQMIKVVSNTALPQLSRSLENRQQRQAFYVSTVWHQSLYLGGAIFQLCYWLLAGLAVSLVGDEFEGAADLFARFSWLLIPLLIIYGLRVILISNRQMHSFLLAMLAGLVLLLAQLFVLALFEAVSVASLLVALGISYCMIAGIILALVRQRVELLSMARFTVPLLLMAACTAAFILSLKYSPGLAVMLGLLPLIAASALDIKVSYRKISG